MGEEEQPGQRLSRGVGERVEVSRDDWSIVVK